MFILMRNIKLHKYRDQNASAQQMVATSARRKGRTQSWGRLLWIRLIWMGFRGSHPDDLQYSEVGFFLSLWPTDLSSLREDTPTYPPFPAGLIANSRSVRYIMQSVRGAEGVAIYPLSLCDGIHLFKTFNLLSGFDLASRYIAHVQVYVNRPMWL